MSRNTKAASNSMRRKRSSKPRRLRSEQLEARVALSVTPFPSNAGLYQIYSNHGQTGLVDPAAGTFQNTTHRAAERVNAAGFRPADNFAYGILTASHELARIGADGQTENLGAIEGLPTNKGTYFVGDFANDDLLWIRNSGQMDQLYGVNVETSAVEQIIQTDTPLTNIFDIAFNPVDETFYASRRGPENELIAISKEGAVTVIGKDGLQKITFGAMYADSEGTVFGGANQTGRVYSFNLETGVATYVADGPKSGTNDGFSNFTNVLELPPTATDDVFATEAISVVVGNVGADNGNGEDVDGNRDSLSVTAVNGVTDLTAPVKIDSGADVTMNETGSFLYDPGGRYDDLAPGLTATDSFSYTLTDDTGRSDTATATITIEGVGRRTGFEDHTVTGLNGPNVNRELVNLGDINGDGFADAAVSNPNAANGAGEIYVFFGTENGLPDELDIKTLRTVNGQASSAGVVLRGANANDRAGVAIAAAGDVNGDGLADLVIGASDSDTNAPNSGSAYVVFGNQNLAPEVLLSSIHDGDGSAGFVAHGTSAHDLTGSSVAGIGDINGDGYDDVAISSPHVDVDGMRNAGQAYVVFGSPVTASSSIELASLRSVNGGDGSRGFVMSGLQKHAFLGSHLEGGVDLNGDGLPDLLVTAPNTDVDGMVDAGESYVLYGRESGDGLPPDIDLRKLRNIGNTEGFVITGSVRKSRTGGYVRISDDLNNDGHSDLVIGMGNTSSSERYVLFCGSTFEDKISIASLHGSTLVYVDNFDVGNPDFDSRDWDQYGHSVTLHSDVGNSVTIWGDPHVVITLDGITEKFDIGYGAGSVRLNSTTTVSWNTVAYDANNPDALLPLTTFAIDQTGSDNDISLNTLDKVDAVDLLTGLSDADIRELAAQLRTFAGDAKAPLTQRAI